MAAPSNKGLLNIFLKCTTASALVDFEGNITACNNAFEQLSQVYNTKLEKQNTACSIQWLLATCNEIAKAWQIAQKGEATTCHVYLTNTNYLFDALLHIHFVPLPEWDDQIWIQIIEDQSHQRLQSLLTESFHNIKSGTLLIAAHKGLCKLNPSFARMLEIKINEADNESLLSLEQLITQNPHIKILTDEYAANYEGEVNVSLPSGKKRFFHLTKSIIEKNANRELQLISLLDYTEIYFTYNELKKSEQFFRSISKNFPHGAVGIVNNKYEFLFYDGTRFPKAGFEQDAYLGDSVFSAFDPSNHERLKLAIDRGFAGIGDEFEITCGGSIFIINTVPISNQGNKYSQVMLVLRDVTQILKAEREAELYSKYLKQIIDTDPNFIYVKNHQNEFLLANKALKDFFQIPEKLGLDEYNDYLDQFLNQKDESEAADSVVFEQNKSITYEEAIINPKTGKTHTYLITKSPLQISEQEIVLLGVGMDITSIRQAEHEIELQKDYLRQIIDTDPNIIFVKNPKGEFVLVNKAFADYYLSTPEELIGKTDKDLGWGEADLLRFMKTDATVFNEKRVVTMEEKVVNPRTKNISYFLSTKKPLEFKKGEPLLLGVAVNITGRRVYEEKLKSSEALLQEVFEKAADALYLLDAESEEIVDCNQKAIALFGFENKSDVKGPLSGLILSKQLKAEEVLNQLRKMDAKNFWNVEAEILTPSGVSFWANMAATKFYLEGKAFYLLRISDISYQKMVENQIMQSLHEKEILIQEIHHRVKNNMAVISSLLQLQSGYITDPAMLEVFRDSQNRIKSMALIHEKLYQSSTLALIEFESYVKELARTILYSYNQTTTQIIINVHIKEIQLDINAAVPCGLIINELLSNACKHAFVGRAVGKIDIYFEKQGEFYVLKVQDDGVGLPSKDIINNSKSLGMTLIQALTSQLNAQLDIDIHNGTTFTLTFKNKPKKSNL